LSLAGVFGGSCCDDAAKMSCLHHKLFSFLDAGCCHATMHASHDFVVFWMKQQEF